MIIPQKMLDVPSIQLFWHLPPKPGMVLLGELHDDLCGCAELQCLLRVESAWNAVEPATIERSTPRVDFDSQLLTQTTGLCELARF